MILINDLCGQLLRFERSQPMGLQLSKICGVICILGGLLDVHGACGICRDQVYHLTLRIVFSGPHPPACFALLSSALLCFALLCFAHLIRRFALLCFAWFAWLCLALLCFAVLCFALVRFAWPCCQSPSQPSQSSAASPTSPLILLLKSVLFAFPHIAAGCTIYYWDATDPKQPFSLAELNQWSTPLA